jgi:transcriptional antiterminator RfaH
VVGMNLWYVIQTKCNREEEVQSFLSTKGIETFDPLMEAFRIRNGKESKKLMPLFPTYLFGKFDIEQDYPLIRWARGVKKILSFGGHPTPVSEAVVELIRQRTDGNGIVKKNFSFVPNETIKIKSGPLKDLLGIFERWVSDRERVRILLNVIGYQPTVEMHFSMIEKVA